MRTKTFARVFLLALGVAAATAACGSSTAPVGTSGPTSTAPTPTVTGQPATSTPTPTASTDETANPAISSLSACTLLTQAQAASITGISGVTRASNSDQGNCVYSDPHTNANAAELYVEAPVGSFSYLTALLAGEFSGSLNIIAVPGIGDAAYDFSASTYAGLAFEKTGIVVVILSNPPGSKVRSGSAQLSAIQTLATSIAAHL
jgi:hypothetical protein